MANITQYTSALPNQLNFPLRLASEAGYGDYGSSSSMSSTSCSKQSRKEAAKRVGGILGLRNPNVSRSSIPTVIVNKTGQSKPPAIGQSNSSSSSIHSNIHKTLHKFDENSDSKNQDTAALQRGLRDPHEGGQIDAEVYSNCDDGLPRQTQPLRHWVRQLRLRHLQKRYGLKRRQERWPLYSSDESDASESEEITPQGSRHKKSSSWSSNAFVTAVKSTTISLASFPTLSRRKSQSSCNMLRNVGSKNTIARVRRSIERSSDSSTCHDHAASTRALLRQRILYEIMSTEASYIDDLKALILTYRLIIDIMPTATTIDVHQCILGILDLHEKLLDELREIGIGPVLSRPAPLCRKVSVKATKDPEGFQHAGHRRSKSSNDALQTCGEKNHADQCDACRSISGPKDAAYIAKIFKEKLSSFFLYEEYAATYTKMLKHLTMATGKIPQWHSLERGLETLVNTMAPVTPDTLRKNKSLTYGDLLIKPIQRICRYPLLFADLLKYTPVIDCPNSHAEVEKILHRLQETAEEINKATTDEYSREKIERSWKLQDLLHFSKGIHAPFPLRSLGRVELCGALHIAYQSHSRVNGCYMLCALFRSYFLVAIPVWGSSGESCFSIVASISLLDLKLENADNEQGVQCHTTPFTWKLIFESNQRLFELVLSAASRKEEQEWRIQMMRLVERENESYYKDERDRSAQYSALALNIQPMGNGYLARRLSIQRSATVGARPVLREVIIKNTWAPKERLEEQPSLASLARSQSLLLENGQTDILCPRRTDRIRIEQQMADVWSKEFLPYPAMTTVRERGIRRSASHVIRKLSKGSMTSSIAKPSRTGYGTFDLPHKKARDNHPASADPPIIHIVNDGTRTMANGAISPRRRVCYRPNPGMSPGRALKQHSPFSKHALRRSKSLDTGSRSQASMVSFKRVSSSKNPLSLLRSFSVSKLGDKIKH